MHMCKTCFDIMNPDRSERSRLISCDLTPHKHLQPLLVLLVIQNKKDFFSKRVSQKINYSFFQWWSQVCYHDYYNDCWMILNFRKYIQLELNSAPINIMLNFPLAIPKSKYECVGWSKSHTLTDVFWQNFDFPSRFGFPLAISSGAVRRVDRSDTCDSLRLRRHVNNLLKFAAVVSSFRHPVAYLAFYDPALPLIFPHPLIHISSQKWCES